jgi:hypothetical protein
MKQLGFFLPLALAVMLTACGSSSKNNSINGNWSATLTNPNGSPAFAFTTSLNQASGTAVTVTNLTFTTATPCFTAGGTATGGFTVSGTTNGVTTGSFSLTIQSGMPAGNVFSLTGTLNNNSIAGTWTLTGVTSGCTGSGSFTMTKM